MARTIEMERKIVVFDLMGTLFKEGHVVSKVLLPLLRAEGSKISYKKLKQFWREYERGEITRKEWNKIVAPHIEKACLESLELDVLAKHTIRSLRGKGYLAGILSNLPSAWGNFLVKKHKLANLHPIVFSGDFGALKPNGELYADFIDEAQMHPHNCYFVDDQLVNLKESELLDMHAVHIKREPSRMRFSPEFTIESLGDLPHTLKNVV